MSTHLKHLAVSLSFILISFLSIFHSQAANITPDDPVFGANGHRIVDVFSGSNESVMDVLELSDGRYYVLVGNTATNTQLSVLRYHPDGTLDTTFNGTGIRTVTFGTLAGFGPDYTHNFSSAATSRGRLAVDSQGRVIIGLESISWGASGISVGRLTSTGANSPFTAVNTNHEYHDATSGFNFYDLGGMIHGAAVNFEMGGFGGIAVDASDNIMVAGHNDQLSPNINNEDILFFRLNANNGTRDMSYNGSGHLNIDIGDGDNLYNLERDAEGRFVAVGRSGDSDLLTIVRLTSSGLPDSTFGAGGGGTPTDLGALTSPHVGVRTGSVYFSQNSQFLTSIIDDGTRYIVGGNARQGGPDTDGVILAINKSNGQLDATFNGTGYHILDADPTGVDRTIDIARSKVDDKFIIASRVESTNNLAFYSLNANGTIDANYIHTVPNVDQTIGLLSSQSGQTIIIGLRDSATMVKLRLGKPEISITPSSPHDFGVVDALAGTSDHTFTIQNTTSVDMYLRDITITGTGYSISATTCPTAGYLGGNTQVGGGVPADSNCTVTVTFDPSLLTSGGTANGSVTINSGTTSTPSHLQSMTFPDTYNLTASVAIPPEITLGYSQTVVADSVENTPSQTTLTVTIENANPTNATNVSLTKNAPAGLTYVAGSLTRAGDCTGTAPTVVGNMLSLSNQTINANGTCTLTLAFGADTVGVHADPLITNMSATLGTQNYTNLTSNNVGNITVVALPTITKSFSESAILTNNALQATVTLTNNDNTAISAVSFNDSLPSGVQFVAVDSNNCSGIFISTATSFGLASASLGANASCQIVVDLLPTTVGLKTNQITNLTATIGGRVFSSINADNPPLTITEMQQPSVSFTAYAPPQLSLQFSPDVIYTNAPSTLTYTLTNPNAVGIDDIAFNNDISALNIEFESANITGTCIATYGGSSAGSDADELVIAGVDLDANSNCTVIVPITGTDTAGVYTSTVTEIRTAIGDVTINQNDVLTVIAQTTVTKAFAPNPVIATNPTVLTFTVTNPDTITPVTGVGFTDTLSSANISYTGATTGTCTGAGYSASYLDDTLTVSGIDLPINTSCTVIVSINTTVVGIYPNTIANISSNVGAIISPPAVDLTVLDQLTLTKAFDVDTLIVGNESTLTLTLTNPNNLSVSNITFTDDLSAFAPNIAFDTGSVGGTCSALPYSATITPTANLLTVSGLTLGSTSSGNNSCTITVDVLTTGAGTFNNTTSVVQANGSNVAPAASDTLTVLQDVTINKTFNPVTIYEGETSIITIAIVNPNATPLTDVAITDDLSAFGVTLDTSSVTTTCPGTSVSTTQLIGFTGFTIPASNNCTITGTVTGDTGGTYNNVTSPISTDLGDGTNTGTATLTVVAPLQITQTFAPNPVFTPNQTTTTITVINPDPNNAIVGVNFTSTLNSATLDYVSVISNTCAGAGHNVTPSGQTLTVSGVDLPVSGSCNITVSIDTTVAGTYLATIGNITSSIGNRPAFDTGNLTVLERLTVAKDFALNPIIIGNDSTLTFTLTNPNSVSVNNVNFTDDIALAVGNLAFVSGSEGGTCGTATINTTPSLFTVADLTLTANSTCTITVDVETTGTTSYLNTVSLLVGTQTASDSATDTLVVIPDALQVTKTFSPTSIYEGETSTLTILLNNTGSVGLTGITIQDDLSSFGLTLDPATIALTCAGDSTLSTSQLLVASGIDIGATSSCTLTATVTGTTAGSYLNVTTPITSDQGNGFLTGSDTLTVVTPASISQSFTTNPVVAGETTTLTFTISAPDPSVSASNASFTNTLSDPSLSYTGAVTGDCIGVGFSADYAGSPTLSVIGIDLAPNTSCTLSVDVVTSTAGTYPNIITNFSTAIGNLSNPAPIDLIVVDLPTLNKVFMPALISVDGVSEITFTITNPLTGFSNLTGLTFTETLPTGLVVADPTNATNTCSGNVSAIAGGSVIVFDSGALTAGTTCTITVDVTSPTVNTYTNSPTDVTGFDSDQVLNIPVTFAPATLDVVVLPTLAQSFTPDQIGVNGTSTLTFTVTSPLGSPNPITGLTFTETLPSGLVIATPANQTTTCLNGTVNLLGADSFALVGGELGASATCTVSIDVTGDTAGIYTNEPVNVTLFTVNEIAEPLPIVFAPATLEITDRPIVVDVASNLGSLADGDVINDDVNRLSITFNVDLTGADDPANYALLAIGDALDSSVDVCPITPTGDDSLITIDNADYDLASLTITLEINSGVALAEDHYLLVICGDNLQDHLGQALDGDQDGVAGGNYRLMFTVDFDVAPTPEPTAEPTTEPTPNIDVFDPAISKAGLLLPGQLGVIGERLEWVTTVRNLGNASGYNVVVTDTLRPELRIDSVSAPGGTVVINGQTVIVTYAEVQPAQVFNFSIFTTVLNSNVVIDNTVCLTADGIEQRCATAYPAGELPATGETPFWAELLRRILGN